ncbi:MAG: FecR domain-containing protein [Acidobacteria bacterium]|nr:FecR domain-containing protein [Acidobacteriota bacterium]
MKGKILKQAIALFLCVLIGMPAWCVPPADTQHAGQISALLPSAERNSKPAKTKEDLAWNDLLKTEHTGRLRALLMDGSTLSMGSDTQMKVVQHDTASQQTAIEMGVGQLRSRVSKITNPNGKFEVKTPQAVIGVIGTDFYVGVANGKTTVICYSGMVTVTPIAAALAATNSTDSTGSAGSAGSMGGPFTVPAGQMIEISNMPPVVQPTPASLQTETISATNVPNVAAGAAAAGAGVHGILGPVLGVVIAGAVAGIAVGTSRNNPGNPPPVQNPTGCQNVRVCGTSAR